MRCPYGSKGDAPQVKAQTSDERQRNAGPDVEVPDELCFARRKARGTESAVKPSQRSALRRLGSYSLHCGGEQPRGEGNKDLAVQWKVHGVVWIVRVHRVRQHLARHHLLFMLAVHTTHTSGTMHWVHEILFRWS